MLSAPMSSHFESLAQGGVNDVLGDKINMHDRAEGIHVVKSLLSVFGV